MKLLRDSLCLSPKIRGCLLANTPVFVEVDEQGYVPTYVKACTHLTTFMFTTMLDDDTLIKLQEDPKVLVVEPASSIEGVT